LSQVKTIAELSDEAVFGTTNPLWSNDGDKVLLQISDIIGPGQASMSVEGIRTFMIETNQQRFGELTGFGRATTAFWSLDGQKIYYFGSSDLAVANIDGSGKQVCETCPKWEGVVYTGAVSLDGARVAVLDTLEKLTITNSDFSNPVEFALSLSDNDTLPDYIQWSPDGKKLGIKVSANGGTKHSIMVMEPDTGEQQELVTSQSNQNLTLCGWSPDSQGLLYIRSSWETGVTELVFADVTKNTERPLFHLDDSCPVWLSSH
jgi:Tol biopolymer transport system component